MKKYTIAIIGVGSVGSTIAYTLLLHNISATILLIDTNEARCRGHFLDLLDAQALFDSSTIKMSSLKEARDADIIIIAAGKPQKIGESRLELFNTNRITVETIIQELCPINPHAIVIMVTNPVDLMTLIAYKKAHLSRYQLFGTGTYLDSQRIAGEVSRIFNVHPTEVNIPIIGEHGDSQCVIWSQATVNKNQLDQSSLMAIDKESLENTVKQRAYEIIACKGATYYGIACCVVNLCAVIINNTSIITCLSIYQEEYSICASLSVTLEQKGITKIINLPLTRKEQNLYMRSIQKLQGILYDDK